MNDRAALLVARDALASAMAVIDAQLEAPESDPLVSVKVAAAIWGVCENAALKRMKRIGAKGLDGRWYARRSAMASRF